MRLEIGLISGVGAFTLLWFAGVIRKRTSLFVAGYASLVALALYVVFLEGTTERLYLLGELCILIGGLTALAECVRLFRQGAGLLLIGLLLMTTA